MKDVDRRAQSSWSKDHVQKRSLRETHSKPTLIKAKDRKGENAEMKRREGKGKQATF